MITGTWSIFLTVLAVSVASAKADGLIQPSALDVSTNLQDYITQTDRIYTDQLASYASQISGFRTDYQRQLDSLSYNTDLVEKQIVAADQRLYPLQSLNEQSKYCVQKYSSLIVTVASVRVSIANCVSQASGALATMMTPVEGTQRVLTSYYNVNWKNGIAECFNKNKDYTNQTICVTRLISASNTYFYNNKVTFVNQMDAARCQATSQIKISSECVFTTVNNALSSISVSIRLIDDCIAGIDLCEPCEKTNVTTLVGHSQPPSCPHSFDLKLNSELLTSDTIKNPFRGVSATSECIVINFTDED